MKRVELSLEFILDEVTEVEMCIVTQANGKERACNFYQLDKVLKELVSD